MHLQQRLGVRPVSRIQKLAVCLHKSQLKAYMRFECRSAMLQPASDAATAINLYHHGRRRLACVVWHHSRDLTMQMFTWNQWLRRPLSDKAVCFLQSLREKLQQPNLLIKSVTP